MAIPNNTNIKQNKKHNDHCKQMLKRQNIISKMHIIGFIAGAGAVSLYNYINAINKKNDDNIRKKRLDDEYKAVIANINNAKVQIEDFSPCDDIKCIKFSTTVSHPIHWCEVHFHINDGVVFLEYKYEHLFAFDKTIKYTLSLDSTHKHIMNLAVESDNSSLITEDVINTDIPMIINIIIQYSIPIFSRVQYLNFQLPTDLRKAYTDNHGSKIHKFLKLLKSSPRTKHVKIMA